MVKKCQQTHTSLVSAHSRLNSALKFERRLLEACLLILQHLIYFVTSGQNKCKCVPTHLNVIYSYSTHLTKICQKYQIIEKLSTIYRTEITRSPAQCLYNCRVTCSSELQPLPWPCFEIQMPISESRYGSHCIFYFLSITTVKTPGEIFRRQV